MGLETSSLEWRRGKKKMEIEDMKRRIENGEFETFEELNDAWADLHEGEMQKMGKQPNYNPITGLWQRVGNKVAYDGRTREDITIPAGAKILCFYGNPEEGTRQPEFNLVYITYDD